MHRGILLTPGLPVRARALPKRGVITRRYAMSDRTFASSRSIVAKRHPLAAADAARTLDFY